MCGYGIRLVEEKAINLLGARPRNRQLDPVAQAGDTFVVVTRVLRRVPNTAQDFFRAVIDVQVRAIDGRLIQIDSGEVLPESSRVGAVSLVVLEHPGRGYPVPEPYLRPSRHRYRTTLFQFLFQRAA